jgi:hypothetical protein
MEDHPGIISPMFRLDPTWTDGSTIHISGGGMPILGGGKGDAVVTLEVEPYRTLWQRRKERQTWSTEEQLTVSVVVGVPLSLTIMGFCYVLALLTT